MHKMLGLMYFWASETGNWDTIDHLGVSSATVAQWYQYFRDVCTWKLMQTPLVLGGVGKVFQIDESVMVKAKYNRGHRSSQRWVFSVYDPETKHMELVN